MEGSLKMIAKIRRKYLALFISFLMIFSFINPVVAFADSGDSEEKIVTVSVEKFTLGQGYYIEPIQISIEEGETVGNIMPDVLGSGNYNDGTDTDSISYLANIKDPNSGPVNIPEYIQLEVERDIEDNTDDWLGQFDFTDMSGWMYLANNEMAPVGMAQYELEDGDVIRWQFSVYEWGADLGFGYPDGGYLNPSDKDDLTAKIAEINSHPDKDELLSNSLLITAYENAYNVLSEMESDQEKVDQSLVELNEALEYAAVDKTELEMALSDANSVHNSVEISKDGKDIDPTLQWVTETIKNDYLAAIEDVDKIFNQDNFSQQEVDNALLELETATETFNANIKDGVKKELPSTDLDTIDQVISDTVKHILDSENGVNTDWKAIGVAQSNYDVPESYLETFNNNISKQIVDSNRVKVTDIERLVLAAGAYGLDPRDVDGLDLIELLYNSDKMTSQGNNGVIYGLLALDSSNYNVSDDAEWTREKLVNYLLDNQNEGGSWSLFGSTPNVDLTGTALAALAPYQTDERVAQAIEEAVGFLSIEQGEEGGYADPFVGGVSSETTSQVIIGLSSVGIDPTSEAFTKNGNNLITHQLSYQTEDGGFAHLIDLSSDSMATEQALQALVAYKYFLKDEGNLYQFGPIEEPNNGDSDNKEEVVIETETITNAKEATTTVKAEDISNKPDSVVVVQPKNAKNLNKLTSKVELNALEALMRKNNELKLNKEDAAIHIPASVLKQLSEKANDQAVTINLEKYESKNAVGSVYDFTIEAGSTNVTRFDGEEITLTLQVDEKVAKKLGDERIKAFHFNEKTNEWEVIENSEYDPEKGLITFKTKHLSIFGVFELNDENLEEPTITDSQESNDEGSSGEGSNDESSSDEGSNDEGSSGEESNDEASIDEGVESSEDQNEEALSQTNDGEKLPQTANHFYLYLLIGLVLLVGGSLLLFYRYKSDRKEV